MMAWSGLMRKEWTLTRWSIITLIVVNIAIAIFSFAPMAVGAIVNISLEMTGLVDMWSNMHIFFAAALFLQSLHTDLKQPDVWFHSPASIWKLLGVKVVMATFLMFVSLFLCGLMAGTAYFLGGYVEVSTAFQDVSMIFQVLVNILVSALFFISTSLFIWVVYKISASKIGWFAGVVLIFLVFSGMSVWIMLKMSWEMMGMTSAFIYITISIVLYGCGAVLLEKKVRY